VPPVVAVRNLIGSVSNLDWGLKNGQINSLSGKLNSVLPSIQQGAVQASDQSARGVHQPG